MMPPNLTPDQKEQLKMAHRSNMRIQETWALYSMFLSQQERPQDALRKAIDAVAIWSDWMDDNEVEPPDIEIGRNMMYTRCRTCGKIFSFPASNNPPNADDDNAFDSALSGAGWQRNAKHKSICGQCAQSDVEQNPAAQPEASPDPEVVSQTATCICGPTPPIDDACPVHRHSQVHYPLFNQQKGDSD